MKVAVVGATGYAGAELVRILTGHPDVTLTAVTSRQYAGEPFSTIYPALTGMRGEPGVDLAAIADLLVRVARLASDFPQIAEMDLNPILTYPAGTLPVAVDVRLKLAKE